MLALLALLAIVGTIALRRKKRRSVQDVPTDDPTPDDEAGPTDGQGHVEYEYYHTYATVGDPRDRGELYGHPTIEDRRLMEVEGTLANPGGVPGGVSGG